MVVHEAGDIADVAETEVGSCVDSWTSSSEPRKVETHDLVAMKVVVYEGAPVCCGESNLVQVYSRHLVANSRDGTLRMDLAVDWIETMCGHDEPMWTPGAADLVGDGLVRESTLLVDWPNGAEDWLEKVETT